jgi:transposase
VRFTEAAYGPIMLVCCWAKGYQEPLYLVSNMTIADEACHWYTKRFRIETFFSDQKSRGARSQGNNPWQTQGMALGVSRSSRIFLWSWSPLSGIRRPSVSHGCLPPGDVMEPRSEPTNTVWSCPFTPQDWEQTPPAVPAYVRTLADEGTQRHDRVETLEARLTQHSTTSSKPPSADSPSKQSQRHVPSTTPRKAGGKPGHPGHRQGLLPPTTVQALRPERCACGTTTLALPTPYPTHQVSELPAIAMAVTHGGWPQGWCVDGGRWTKAQGPAEQATGYGPRCRARMGELAGTDGNGRRIVQTFGASVLQGPIRLGAIQKVLERVTQAIAPYYAVMAQQARQALGNSIDETPWSCRNALAWLWVMARERVAFSMIHPRRSQEAFAALLDAWEGLLVSEGDGV